MEADVGVEVVGFVDPLSFDRFAAEKGELVVAVEDDKFVKLGNADLAGAVVDGADVAAFGFGLEFNPPLMVNRVLPGAVCEPRFEVDSGAVVDADEPWPPGGFWPLFGWFACEVDDGVKLKGDFVPPDDGGAVPNKGAPGD